MRILVADDEKEMAMVLQALAPYPEAGEAVEVPADMAESYREMMPGATDAEIRTAYAGYLKSIGK